MCTLTQIIIIIIIHFLNFNLKKSKWYAQIIDSYKKHLLTWNSQTSLG